MEEKQMKAKETLLKIKNGNMFTVDQTFDEFVQGLCQRFARMYGEFLPNNDYVYIVKKLEEKEII
jgi:hypothetical protein